MKNLFALFIIGLILFSGCKKKDTSTTTKEKKKSKEVSLVLRFEKNPCFGTCPIYKAKLMSDGTLIYDGINFVKTKGQHEFKVSKQFVSDIENLIVTHQIMTMEDRYDNPNVSDIPSTIIEANHNGVNKNIYARIDLPDDLKVFIEGVHQKIMTEVNEQSGAKYLKEPSENSVIPRHPRKIQKQGLEKKVIKG